MSSRSETPLRSCSIVAHQDMIDDNHGDDEFHYDDAELLLDTLWWWRTWHDDKASPMRMKLTTMTKMTSMTLMKMTSMILMATCLLTIWAAKKEKAITSRNIPWLATMIETNTMIILWPCNYHDCADYHMITPTSLRICMTNKTQN